MSNLKSTQRVQIGRHCNQLTSNSRQKILHLRAMMIPAHFPENTKGNIALECIRTATMLDGLKVVQVGDVTATRVIHVFGSNPAWAPNLRTFQRPL
jgi:hypothetical protein